MTDKNSDDFDEITSGLGKQGNQGEHDVPETAWDAIQLFWPQIMGEGLPIKGVIIVEYAQESGGRGLYFCNNEDATDWDIKGLLSHGQDMIRDESTLNGVFHIVDTVVNNDSDDTDEDGQ